MTHRGQLRAVADDDQPAVAALADVGDQVFEQLPGAEYRTVGRIIGQHRRLVDDKYGPLLFIIVERKGSVLGSQRFLPVNLLMDGVGFRSGVTTHHLGSPPRRRQQDRPDPKSGQGFHQRGDQRSLSRSGVSVQDKNPILRIAAEEPAEALDRIFLRGSWLECEILVNLGGDMFC